MRDFELFCTRCGKQRSIDDMLGKCECSGTLLIEYDLEKINRYLPKDMPFPHQASMWRYHHLLPIKNKTSIVSLGEGLTPLLRIPVWEKRLSLKELWVKREE